MTKRAELALALCIGLLAIAIRVPLMDLPLERDEGDYAYIAWRMTFGETPYLDWFDQKPPAIFVVYRAALGLAGDGVVAIRAFAAAFSAVSSVALFYLVRGLLGAGTGLLAALLLVFLSSDPMIQGSIANTELFMLPGIVIATLLVLRATESKTTPIGAAIGAGVSIGIAIAFKQVAALNIPFFLLVFGLRAPSPERWRRLIAFTAWLGLGIALVWGPIVVWLLLRGALGAAVDATFLHNLSYAGALPLARRLELFAAYTTPLLPSQGVAWALAALGLVSLFLKQNRVPALFLGGWALVNAAGVSISGQYFPHYFQQLLPAVAALASCAILWAPADGALPRLRAVTIGCLAFGPLLATAASFWTLDPAEAIKRIYPHNAFDAMPAIGREIESITANDETVFLFGTEPEILFYAKRASATRYIHLFPLFGPYPDARERQQAVIDEVSRARPAVMVWLPNAMFMNERAPQLLTNWFLRTSARDYRIHAFRVRASDGSMELLRVPDGADPSSVLGGRRANATIFVRKDRALEP